MKLYFGAVAAMVPFMLIAKVPLAAAADPLNDPSSIITFQTENDSFSLPGTDRYYTAGQNFAYVSPTGAVPGPLASLGHMVLAPAPSGWRSTCSR